MIKSTEVPASGADSTIEADVVIVGAGFAGAATAYHLARRGVKRVVVLDKEPDLGVHSSGRNAWMVRQVTSDETISAFARRGASAIREISENAHADGAPRILTESGSVLLAEGNGVPQLKRDVSAARDGGTSVELWDRSETISRYPILEDAPIEAACFCPTDGVVDIFALLRAYLALAESAGARVFLGAAVTEVVRERGSIVGVRTEGGLVRAPIIVNAAGGWAEELGTLAGAPAMPLSPTRRHLFVSEPLALDSVGWPFIWDLTDEVYFRPWHEPGTLLLSGCDSVEPGPELASDAVHVSVEEAMAEKIRRRFPRLADVPVARGWSGIRTLTPDGRFIVGPDPLVAGFFWVAGLGGHGVVASSPVGELAAELILAPENDGENAFSPRRFERKGERTIDAGAIPVIRKSAD